MPVRTKKLAGLHYYVRDLELSRRLYVDRLGNTSVSLGHRIVASDDADVLYCDGNVVLVWIDRASGRAAAVPEAVRMACSPA